MKYKCRKWCNQGVTVQTRGLINKRRFGASTGKRCMKRQKQCMKRQLMLQGKRRKAKSNAAGERGEAVQSIGNGATTGEQGWKQRRNIMVQTKSRIKARRDQPNVGEQIPGALLCACVSQWNTHCTSLHYYCVFKYLFV